MNYKAFLTFVCLIWYTLPVHAQLDCTDIFLPKFFNILVAYDQNCIEESGGEVAARAAITGKMDAAVGDLNTLFAPFNLTFKVVLFSEKNYPNGFQHIDASDAVHNDYYCVPYDGLVFFRGDYAGGNTQGRTALVHNGSASANNIRHEIGHMILGAGHTDDSPCSSSCTGFWQTSNFMCHIGEDFTLTACQLTHLNSVFFANGCSSLLDNFEVLPSDFECADKPSFSLTTDKKILMRGCDVNRTDLMCNLTITGGSVPATISNVTATFQDVVYDFDLSTMGMDFNAVANLPVGNETRELRQLEDPAGNIDGPRQSFLLLPGETKVFMFKLRYNPNDSTIFNVSGLGAASIKSSIRVSIEQQNLPNLLFDIVRTAYPKPIMPVNPSFGFTINNPVTVSGTVVIPNTGTPVVWNPPLVIAKPGSSIRVASGANLIMDIGIPVLIEGCSGMWEGIRVEQNSTLTMDQVEIRDAITAVDIRPQANAVNITNTIFENNEVGIQIEGVPNTAPQLSGLEFRQTADLKVKPTAQNPNPNKFSLFGIKAIDAGNLSVSTHPVKGYGARFDGLRDGVFSKNTNLELTNSTFFNLLPESVGGGTGVISSGGNADITTSSFMNCKTGIRSSGNTLIALGNTFFDMQDTAISANRSTLQIVGNTIFNGKGGVLAKNSGGTVNTNIMNNVRCGVRVTGSVLAVEDNVITGNKVAIGIHGSLNGGLSVRKNTIEATDFGISFYHFNQFYGVPLIEENTITMQGNPNGIGIATAGAVSFPNFGGRIFNNTIHVLEGNSGIAATVAAGIEVVYNHIDLPQQQTSQYGIRLEEGDQLTVTDNDVTGGGTVGTEGEQRAIYGMHTCRSFLSCNYTNNTSIGFNFAGECTAKRPLALQFNTIRNHDLGLLLGIAGNGNAVIGPQVHRENQWAGSYSSAGALHLGDAATAGISKFTADDQLNDDYIPDMYAPAIWFNNEISDGVSYACTRRPGDGAVTDLDIRIAGGVVQGTHDDGALQWMAQRRLYERLAAEGNTDAGLQTFSQGAISNGMADYAQRQTALRTVNSASQSERTVLANIDSVLWARLAALVHARGQRNAATTPAERAQWQTQMEILSVEMAQQRSKKQDFLTDLTQKRTQKAQQELTLPTLGGAEVYKTNERTVHRIWMAQYLGPDGVLTPAQVAELSPIAEQCPLLGGDAVLWARILIQQQADTPIIYPDDQTCRPADHRVEGRSAPAATPQSGQLRVTPNPVSDQLWLDYTLVTGATFYLSDATGRTCATVDLAPGQNRVALSVAALPNGLYHYHMPGFTAGKVIVQH